MFFQDSFEVVGEVRMVLGNQIYRVQLPNRHLLIVHVEKRWRLTTPDFKVGDRVTLQVSPFDLSQGKIVKME